MFFSRIAHLSWLPAWLGLCGGTWADTTWVAAPTDASWATAANWSGSVPSSAEGGAAAVGTVIFNSSSITTVTHSGDRFVAGVRFTGGSNFTINNGSGVLYVTNNNGIEVQGGTQTFGSGGVRARGNINITNNGTKLDFNSDFMLHPATNATFTATFTGTGLTEIERFMRRTSSYDMNVVKNGAGTLNIASFTTTVATSAAGTITGTMTINLGAVRIGNEAALGGNPLAFNAGQLTLNGGTLISAATLTIDDANRGLTLGASGGTFENEGVTVMTVANAITGVGAFTKTGSGTTVLSSSANDYTGETTVLAGTLLVNGSIADSAASVTNAGSVLGGNGTVGDVTVGSGAILLAGNGASASGALTSEGDISLTDNSIIRLTLGAGGAHSSLIRTGGLWEFDDDQAFNLLSATVGTYDNVISGLDGTEAGLDTVGTWTISNAGVVGTFSYDDNGGVDLVVSTVPEPGACLSLVGGFGMLAGFRRLRRRRE
jgi:autotransporter-associated beta strand protein